MLELVLFRFFFLLCVGLGRLNMTKLYLVWNEDKTECVGFVDEKSAQYASKGYYAWEDNIMKFTQLADSFVDIYGPGSDDRFPIQQIEV